LVFNEFLLFINNYPHSNLKEVRRFFEQRFNREISVTSTSRLLKNGDGPGKYHHMFRLVSLVLKT